MRLSANWKSSLLALGLLVLTTGCDLLIKKEEQTAVQPESAIVARVFDTYLYKDDITGIGNGADSAMHADVFVKNWVKKQLLITEAANNIDFDEAEIQRKILDYRYALMVHEYERYIVNDRLNSEVGEAEVDTYYAENQDQFRLNQNLLKGYFIKIPKDAPRLRQLRRLINQPANVEDLRSYCYQFADNYNLDDSTWVDLEEVIKNTPLVNDVTDKADFLKKTDLSISSDDEFNYYLKIKEYKISGEISPLEFVRDDIANIIINRRKIKLADQLRDEVYNQAKRNNDFEIYE